MRNNSDFIRPPAHADVLTTACDYCIVGCGYKVYRWPVNAAHGANADPDPLPDNIEQAGLWVPPSRHNIVLHEGSAHHVAVVPDVEADVVNRHGNHSIRGGALAQKCYNPATRTADRLQTPLMRVRGKLVPVSWDVALDTVARVGRHVVDTHGEHAWAMKMFSYQYFENTYALTKLALRHVATPAFAWHDNPGVSEDTPGLRDTGFDNFGACYEDFSLADTLFLSGSDPFETKTVLWTDWIMQGIRNGMRVIHVLPRKTAGVAWAEKHGGVHLQIIPGTDTVLHMALARHIVEQGWHDAAWIERYTSNKWETDAGFGQGTRNTPWQWRTTWGTLQSKGFTDYRDWLLAQDEAALANAARITGIPEADIVLAAELMARPHPDGTRPKTMIGLEKGCYWSNNYLNTASISALALVCGTGNRPGQMITRLGGHQRGGIKGGRYPIEKSPEKFAGRRRKPLDLDRWVEDGHVRFAWVVGTTWTGAMAASDGLAETIERLSAGHARQITRPESAAEELIARTEEGGMALIDQDIYLRDPIGARLADIVLPAATWGEEDFTRANGERRIRLYAKFYDAPGEARPDWWIAAEVGRRMGYPGYDWPDSNAVFEEAARSTRGSRKDYYPLVWKARREGRRGHDVLAEYGTTGIQGPVRLEGGRLVGTPRLHAANAALPDPEGPTVHTKVMTAFNTQSGRANFMKSPWSMFSDFHDAIKPRDGEIWITNGRINEIWQSGFDDVERRRQIMARWPENFVEIHPRDAAPLGIESGDRVALSSDRVPVQKGAFITDTPDDASWTKLLESGHITFTSARIEAIAMVTPATRPGVAFTYFLSPRSAANSLAPRVVDPVSNNYRYKLGVGRLERLGASRHKHAFNSMSFAPRTIV